MFSAYMHSNWFKNELSLIPSKMSTMVFASTIQIKLMIYGYWHVEWIETGQCMLAHRQWINIQTSSAHMSVIFVVYVTASLLSAEWNFTMYICCTFAVHLSSDGIELIQTCGHCKQRGLSYVK